MFAQYFIFSSPLINHISNETIRSIQISNRDLAKELKDDTRLKMLNTQFPEKLLLTYKADNKFYDSTSLSNSRLLYDRSRCSCLRWHWNLHLGFHLNLTFYKNTADLILICLKINQLIVNFQSIMNRFKMNLIFWQKTTVDQMFYNENLCTHTRSWFDLKVLKY